VEWQCVRSRAHQAQGLRGQQQGRAVHCRVQESGNASKAAHIDRKGYVVNDKDKLCITGYKNLGDASKAAHIERKGYVVNDKDSGALQGTKIWVTRPKLRTSSARAMWSMTRACCASQGTRIWVIWQRRDQSHAHQARGLHGQRQGRDVHHRIQESGRFG